MSSIRALHLFVFALIFASSVSWSGNVSVHPKRLVFENGQNQAQVYLMNLGDKPTTMRVAFRNYRMLENGQLQPVFEPGTEERFAAPFVRYSPKRVRLQPGESQLVRVRIDKRRLPEAGEYRSHLAFTAEPEVSRQSPSASKSTGEKKRIQIALKPVFGSSIPIIIRHGPVKAETRVVDVVLDERGDKAKVRVVLGRSGTASAYGDLIVIRSPEQGEPVVLTQAKGVGIYPPLTQRFMTLAVPANLRHHLAAKSELSVIYTAHDSPHQVLAESPVLR